MSIQGFCQSIIDISVPSLWYLGRVPVQNGAVSTSGRHERRPPTSNVDSCELLSGVFLGRCLADVVCVLKPHCCTVADGHLLVFGNVSSRPIHDTLVMEVSDPAHVLPPGVIEYAS